LEMQEAGYGPAGSGTYKFVTFQAIQEMKRSQRGRQTHIRRE